MADYSKATNFTAKDGLPTGNAGKIVKGTEIDTEFTAIASAIASKGDINSPTFTGTPAVPTASLGTNTTQIASCAFAIANGVPSGSILLWSGSIASIPTGWVLCNGSNSTPDLRDRFVVGAGTTYAVGATGGANTVTLDATMIPAHTHSISASGTTSAVSDDHSHTFSGTTSGHSVDHSHSGTTGGMNANNPHNHNVYNINGGGGNPGGDLNSSAPFDLATSSTNIDHGHAFTTGGVSTDHNHTYSGTTSGMSANHTHTVTVTGTSGNGTGGGAAHENRPPYYSLAYIMKS